MEKKFLAILSIVIAVFASISVAGIATADCGKMGAVYTIDNAAAGNHVLYYSRGSDGTIAFVSSISTGGMGTGTAFHSQGALALTDNGRFLLVVNTESNTITVFNVQSNGMPIWSSTTSSHGTMPISLTVSDNWVYVLNAGGTGNIAGFMLEQIWHIDLHNRVESASKRHFRHLSRANRIQP